MEILKELGFAGKEIEVYLKLLELGVTTVQRLSELTGINRVTLYGILERLIAKGVAGSTIIKSTKHFYAVPPEKFLEQIKEKEKKFEEILPQLKARMAIIGVRPKVEFYEGTKGVLAVESDVLKTERAFYAYGSFMLYDAILTYVGLSFRKKRLVKKLRVFAVSDSSALGLFKRKEYMKYTEFRILDFLKDMPTWTYIYNNKVAVVALEKEQPIAVIIDCKQIYLKEKTIFDLLWKIARRPKK